VDEVGARITVACPLRGLQGSVSGMPHHAGLSREEAKEWGSSINDRGEVDWLSP